MNITQHPPKPRPDEPTPGPPRPDPDPAPAPDEAPDEEHEKRPGRLSSTVAARDRFDAQALSQSIRNARSRRGIRRGRLVGGFFGSKKRGNSE
jgi:hypothetical protein